MKNKKNYQTVRTVPKSYRKIEEAKLKPLSHISGVAFIEATEAVASVKKNNCINKIKINVNCSNNIFIT
jgi:uncharacterized UPF0160 family protein